MTASTLLYINKCEWRRTLLESGQIKFYLNKYTHKHFMFINGFEDLHTLLRTHTHTSTFSVSASVFECYKKILVQYIFGKDKFVFPTIT